MNKNQKISKDVGKYYDNEFGQFWKSIQEGHMHVGYWEDEKGNTPKAEAAKKLTKKVIDLTLIQKHGKLLDIGCGYGKPAICLAKEKGCHVDGITISESQYKECIKNVQSENIGNKVHFYYGDAMELPFISNYYDGVWFFESIFHMPDRVKALGEANRVLKKNGILIIADIIERKDLPGECRNFIFKTFKFSSIIKKIDYQYILEKAGFKIMKMIDISKHTVKSQWANVELLKSSREKIIKSIGIGAFLKMVELWPEAAQIYESYLGYLLISAIKV